MRCMQSKPLLRSSSSPASDMLAYVAFTIASRSDARASVKFSLGERERGGRGGRGEEDGGGGEGAARAVARGGGGGGSHPPTHVAKSSALKRLLMAARLTSASVPPAQLVTIDARILSTLGWSMALVSSCGEAAAAAAAAATAAAGCPRHFFPRCATATTPSPSPPAPPPPFLLALPRARMAPAQRTISSQR